MAQKQIDKENLKDYEGGYGGGRQRLEEMHDHAFGERGWGTSGGDREPSQQEAETKTPEPVKETHDPNWQEKFVKENADKFGQGGGHPIEQRGPAHSTGGESEEEEVGDVRNVSPRGGYGIRETEKWPKPQK